MLRKSWLALAAALCSTASPLCAQDYTGFAPINAPVVQFTDNHDHADDCLSGIMAGGEIYFLRPFINNNTALITTTGIGTAAPIQLATDFDWNYHVAPAAWLGWTSKCGVGFRARYFGFDQSSQPIIDTLSAGAATTSTITAPAGLSPSLGTPSRGFQSPGVLLQGGTGADSITATSDLRIQTIDGEATYAHDWCHLSCLLTIGGRYLQMRQNYQATLSNVPTAGTSENSFLEAGHNFYGGGPTISWQGRWMLGRSGLSVFGLARGSIIVGSSRLTATFAEFIVDPVNGNQTNLAASESRDHIVIPIGELEGGLEYSCPIGRTRLFVRGAAVNHTYFDAGSASSRGDNLSLFGAQVSIGLNY